MRDVPICYFIEKLTKLKSVEYKLNKISFIINPNMVKLTYMYRNNVFKRNRTLL